MGILDNKVALITGSTSGMGETTAKLFAKEGAKVIVSGLNDEEGQQIVEEIQKTGGQADYQHLDVTSESSWHDLVAKLSQLDVLVNNAGIDIHSTLKTEMLEDWDKVLRVNLTGPMLGIKEVVPLMEKQGHGSIINISSAAGNTGCPYTVYSTAKWGLRGLTRSAAYLYGDDNIHVNAILPGMVKTPLVPDSFMKSVEPALPGKRGAKPLEIAQVSLFLASDKASYINGQDISVDNGMDNLGVFEGLMRAINSGK
ncbi:SDR family NAD(P)-dependent oxidoreductase [Limosilactobacillus sp.]|jgi:3alpha(or 20beta)-hydroxysteroid dehydrogenase|uniref:SDR family NAD(P)-dependent oxidoreductase n=1 Tax=Limosilactobacillus sp. TaxID=2773925 RepID=UPI0025C47953|nr:SDR family oxidoreductase [Limosilactobacillus sp.]MCH3921595.1 SDR family oxidoreductase [Limosilactobacillus sp.]MCH3928366.1 SDR family oxidoreductase [Limosilactobacillus sp.]